MEKSSVNGDAEVYELAICFARMWGVAETLSPLPNLGFPEIKDRMIRWAKECIEGSEEDILMFFRRKLVQAERMKEEEKEEEEKEEEEEKGKEEERKKRKKEERKESEGRKEGREEGSH